MKFFYNVAYFFFAVVYLPTFLVKIKQSQNQKHLLLQRFGKLDESWVASLPPRNTLWIHAVSVGEVMAVENFIREFLERNLDAAIVLTTVTPTGQAVANKLQLDRLYVAYFPFDFSACMKNYFEKIKPICFLLVETEIWPNAILQATEHAVPVGIINARLSEKSTQRYSTFSFIFRGLFNKIDFVWAQTTQDAERFQKVGIKQSAISVLGNMKYDELICLPSESPRAKEIAEIYLKQGKKILLAGSTHPNEEEMIAKAFLRLQTRFKDWVLFIVPRHIERNDEIREKLVSGGLKVGVSADKELSSPVDVLIVNELGILKNLYQYSDLVFMGGSLVKRGGQNPIEALRFKKAIVYGPYTYNFSETYRRVCEHDGGVQLQNENDLEQILQLLMKDEEKRNTMGKIGYESLTALCGATEKHLDELNAKLYQPSECVKG